VYVVASDNAVLLKNVMFAAVSVIWMKGVQFADAPIQRSSLNPVSSSELSDQVRSIEVKDTAVAFKFPGAVGGDGGGGGCAGVVTSDTFEYADEPLPLKA
jgi:hypothetical protein